MVQSVTQTPNSKFKFITTPVIALFIGAIGASGDSALAQTEAQTPASTTMTKSAIHSTGTKVTNAKFAGAKKSTAKTAANLPAKPKITTLQEGWYKMSVGGLAAGYFVQRVEFNSATKQFIATTYLRTSAVGGNINESLKSYAAENLAPISYQYTSLTDKGGKTIDATFKKSVASLVITEDGKVKTEQVKFKDGSLLSSMLVYTILRNKAGVKVGNNYGYVGVAEEEGRAYNGTSWVQEETKYEGQSAFKILNKFKDQQFISYVTPTGKILATRFPAENIELKLVPTRDEAVGTIPVNEKTLTLLFGQLPDPGTPPLSTVESSVTKTAPAKADSASKTDGATKGSGDKGDAPSSADGAMQPDVPTKSDANSGASKKPDPDQP